MTQNQVNCTDEGREVVPVLHGESSSHVSIPPPASHLFHAYPREAIFIPLATPKPVRVINLSAIHRLDQGDQANASDYVPPSWTESIPRRSSSLPPSPSHSEAGSESPLLSTPSPPPFGLGVAWITDNKLSYVDANSYHSNGAHNLRWREANVDQDDDIVPSKLAMGHYYTRELDRSPSTSSTSSSGSSVIASPIPRRGLLKTVSEPKPESASRRCRSADVYTSAQATKLLSNSCVRDTPRGLPRSATAAPTGTMSTPPCSRDGVAPSARLASERMRIPAAKTNGFTRCDEHDPPVLCAHLTPSRLLTTLCIVAFGVPKAVASYQGNNVSATTLDWISAVAIGLMLYWLSCVDAEAQRSGWRKWFFRVDMLRAVIGRRRVRLGNESPV